MGTVKLSGVAFLCFAEDDSRFQGVVVPTDNSGAHLGVAGHLGGPPPPTDNFDECCFDGQQAFYDITLGDGVVIRHAMRIGGDNCTLRCDQLLFETRELLVGRSAEEYIAKNFPERFRNKDCYVCIGQMTLYDA